MTLNLVVDVSPRLETLWRETLTHKDALIMASIADFKTKVLARIAQMQQTSADEHAQVLAAFEQLKSQVGETISVSDADVSEVDAAFDAAMAGIGSIFTPEAVAAARAKRGQ